MPTTPHLPRRDSWPPTIISLSPTPDINNFPTPPNYQPTSSDLNMMDMDMDMDENPFSYFLESPSPEDYDDSLDLSAGIEGSSTPPRPEVREVSPSSLMARRYDDALKVQAEEGRRLKRERTREREMRRQQLEEEEAMAMGRWLGVGVPLSLRDFTDRQEKGKKRRAGGGQMAGISGTQRGRGVVRLTPSHRAAGRGRSRSASVPRRHSWREPSPEIVSIPEEAEHDAMILDVDRREETPDLLSDNGMSELDESGEYREPEVVRKKAKVGKEKKRVRWAMPVGAEIDG